MKYRNPVVPGFHPDPSVCRVGRDYYLVTSSFEYFPGVPIFHSRDLVHWQKLGHCLTRDSQLPLGTAGASAGVYAPTLRYHAGTFYMTTTNVSGGGNFIVSAASPEGPWSDPVLVAQPGIDPSLFFDVDGSVLYTTAYGGAFQSRIDVRTGQLLCEPRLIWGGTGGQHPEGPHLYLRDGYYYLLISEGGTEYGHMITMARSKSPWGPFEPCAENPVLTHRSWMSPIQVVGHADLVDTPEGDWFAVALAVRPHGYPPCYHLGRETFLAPVKWAEGAFPVFGDQGRLALEMDSPLDAVELAPDPARDDFDRPELSPCWNFLRNPERSLYSLSERPGHLKLQGSAVGLDDVASPAWLGRRQCHFAARFSVALDFEPSAENEEAGITVRMNERHHYELFTTRRGGARAVVLRRRIGSLQAEVGSFALPAGDGARLELYVEASRATYRFAFAAPGQAAQVLGEGETRYLSTEVAGGFTGVFFALYATGNGKPCARPAWFDWAEYTELPDLSG